MKLIREQFWFDNVAPKRSSADMLDLPACTDA